MNNKLIVKKFNLEVKFVKKLELILKIKKKRFLFFKKFF